MKKIIATVNYVADGDTINFSDLSGNTFDSRARWIDAPETKKSNQSSDSEQILLHWEWGKRSKQFLSLIFQPIIDTKSQVILYSYEPDRYGRILSDWYLNTTALKNNLQFQLISQGLAVPFLPFDKYDFPVSRELSLFKGIVDATAKAYKANLGFWPDYKSGKFILPNEFKKLTF